MTDFTCRRCHHKDSIKWGVNGNNIKLVEINASCTKCDSPIKIVIEFPADPNGKPKVRYENETDYIG